MDRREYRDNMQRLDISCMRDAISRAYSGKSWKQKVSKMPDNQIIAVYNRLLKEDEEERLERSRARNGRCYR